MKTARLILASSFLTTSLLAQNISAPQRAPAAKPTPASATKSADTFPLETLLAPIALYPDPLLAAMLPAATRPDQLTAASNLLSSNADPSQVDRQNWDISVKELARYPAVLTWMAQNADWTNKLGSLLATQEPAVLDTLQRLRANAEAAGMLTNSPQQQVVSSDGAIQIEPAQPGAIFIPYYDPQYIEPDVPAPMGVTLQLGLSYPMAPAAYRIDWRDHAVWLEQGFAEGSAPQRWQPSAAHIRVDPMHSELPRPTAFAVHVTNWSAKMKAPGQQPTGRTNFGDNAPSRPSHQQNTSAPSNRPTS